MADLNLRKVRIRNWATIPEAEIEFPEHGLVLVLGSNVVSEGHLDSLGAGKTNFGAALARAIVGVPDRPIVKFSRKRQGNTYIRVDADLKEKPLVVEIGFKCAELSKTSEGVQFSLDGAEPTSLSHINLTKEELAKTVQMTPALAKWTVWVDGEKLRFDELPQREAIELLMAALHQPSWAAIQKKSAGVLDIFNADRQTAEDGLTRARNSVDRLRLEVTASTQACTQAQQLYQESCDKAQQRIEEANARLSHRRSRLEKAERLQKLIEKKIQKIEEEKAKEYASMESARLEVDGQLRLQRETVRKMSTNYTNKQNERLNEEKPLKRSKTCPTCGQDWKLDPTHLEEAQKKVAKAKEVEAGAKETLEEAKKVETELQDKLDTLDDKLRKQNVRALTRRLSVLHRRVGDLASQHSRETNAEVNLIERLKAPVDRSPVAAAETKKTLKEEALAKSQEDVTTLSADVADIAASLSVLKYWHGSFGPTGISNMVLREAIDPLNEIARRTAQTLCGGMVGIHFATEREMASGDGKDELVVHVDNVLGSSDLEMSSKGERCLSNLIIAETLAELSQSHSLINFCWYDEVVNNLPAHVRMVVLQYLREKARRNRQLIFIVDHYPESANFSDYVLLAEKTASGTAVRWM